MIDTHVLIWWWDEQERLSAEALAIISDAANEIVVSAACGWEMAIKVGKGQLPQLATKLALYEESVTGDGFVHFAIGQQHGIKAGLLPGNHRDPFDRVIAAQALLMGVPVITRDREIAAFGCETLW